MLSVYNTNLDDLPETADLNEFLVWEGPAIEAFEYILGHNLFPNGFKIKNGKAYPG